MRFPWRSPLFLSLLLITSLLAGCPHAASAPSTTPANTGTGGNSTSGSYVNGNQATGVNPSSYSLSDSLGVLSLYPDNGNFTVSLSGAQTAVAAVTSVNKSGTLSLSLNWGGNNSAAAYRIQGLQESGQDRTERLLRLYARHLKATPIPRTTQAVAPISVGDARTFNILDFSTTTPTVATFSAHAVYVYNAPTGQNGSFVIWVDDRDASIFQGASSPLNTIATTLQDHIYPTDTQVFGSDTTIAENNAEPADKRIDITDDYIHFVFTHMVDNGTATTMGDGTLGFFTLTDFTTDPASNHDKILYLASSATSGALNDMLATVAHEFQHLLFSCHRVQTIGLQNHLNEFNSDAIAWLNEGMSMEAMLLNGYGPDGANPSPSIINHIAAYLSMPDQYSMTNFFATNGNPTDAYGMVTLFMQYLDARFGDGILREFHTYDDSATMYDDPSNPNSVDPTDLAEHVLAAHGTSLSQIFPDFAVSLALDGANIPMTASQSALYQLGRVDLRKTYVTPDGNVALQGPRALPPGTNLVLPPFSIGYESESSLSSPLALQFSNATGTGFEARLIAVK